MEQSTNYTAQMGALMFRELSQNVELKIYQLLKLHGTVNFLSNNALEMSVFFSVLWAQNVAHYFFDKH